MDIEQLVKRQKSFFRKGHTHSYAFRIKMLERLERTIKLHEKAIMSALRRDLHKSATESYMTEVGMTLSEISYVRRHLKEWMKPARVKTPLAQFPSVSFTVSEPYGAVLIMSPWNYPFLLSMDPLVGAIAGGNCAIVKPSAYAPATSSVIRKIVEEAFPPEYVAVVEGGRDENEALLEQRFDYIFFTGSVQVGKLVMEKASANLTPVTLELGGKSPCIVDRTADIELAAKRIVFGKFVNSGQTCVAPDYVLIQEEVQEEFIAAAKRWIHRMLGKNPLDNRDYPRIVNQKHFHRVCGLMKSGVVAEGGTTNPETLQIAPTILRDVNWEDAVMQEEIFGPVLPVLSFADIDQAIEAVRVREKPLALYLFTGSRKVEQKVLETVSFGGGCINDTLIHLATPYMGFGGVGNSGMGSYHGQESFRTFTHRKSIVKKSTVLDLPFRYHPYSGTKDKLIRLFLK